MFTYLLHVSVSCALWSASQRALLRLHGGHPLVIGGAGGQRAHRGLKCFILAVMTHVRLPPEKKIV